MNAVIHISVWNQVYYYINLRRQILCVCLCVFIVLPAEVWPIHFMCFSAPSDPCHSLSSLSLSSTVRLFLVFPKSCLLSLHNSIVSLCLVVLRVFFFLDCWSLHFSSLHSLLSLCYRTQHIYSAVTINYPV